VKIFEFSCDITNLSEVNIGNIIYVNVIQTWKRIDTSELLLKYLKIYNKPVSIIIQTVVEVMPHRAS
jgi:hypothetical protein